MKKGLALFVLLISSLSLFAQQKVATQPDCRRDFYFTAAGTSLDFDNRSTACTSWLLVYQSNGFSVVSIEFQSAPDSNQAPGAYVTWANLASGTLPLTSTTGGSVSGFRYQPWVRVKLTTATGTGQLNGTLLGWRPFPGQDATTATNGTGLTASQVQGTAATGSAVVGNPVQVAGKDGSGNAQPISTNTLGVLNIITNNGGADGIANNTAGYVGGTGSTLFTLITNPLVFNGSTWDRQGYCPNTTLVSVAATTTQIVALSGSTKVRVCGFVLSGNATAGSFEIVFGTGANCGTGTASFGIYNVLGATAAPVSYSGGPNAPLITTAGQAVCVRATTTTVTGTLIWGQW